MATTKTCTKKPTARTQTFPSYGAAIKQAIKRGEPSITFKLPKPTAKKRSA